MHYWTHAIGEHGPDHCLSLTFDGGCAAELVTAVQANAPIGFSPVDVTPAADADVQQPTLWYVDEQNAAQFAANHTGQGAQNIWVYHAIMVRDTMLTIERGYGGYTSQHDAAETRLAIDLACDTRLTLVRWAITAGGDGYPTLTIATGDGDDSLLRYLAV